MTTFAPFRKAPAYEPVPAYPRRMASPRLGYMPALDGLRAVAIILVVACHAVPGFSVGKIGVDVFFALSGFLITTLIAEQIQLDTFSRRRFYARRAIRLMPALVVMVAVLTPIALLVTDERRVWWGAMAAILYLSPLGPVTIFYHTWTLAVEEWFYLLWPLALGKMFRNKLTTRQATVVAGGLGLMMQLAMLLDADFFLCRASGLLIGCAVALWWCDGGQLSWHRHAIWLGFAMLFGGLATSSLGPALPFWLAVWGTALILLGVVSNTADHPFRLLELRPMVAIGVVSYEWYLVHVPMIQITYEVWGRNAYWVIVPLSLVFAFALHYALVPLQSRLRYGLDQRVGVTA